MMHEEMIIACCTDIAGKVKGKAFPAVQFDKRTKRGIGWTPTNVQITCFDTIADSPYGSLGDLVLIPDEAARVRIDFEDGGPVEHFALGNIRQTDGRAWEMCTRSILSAALERLHRVTGLPCRAPSNRSSSFAAARRCSAIAFRPTAFAANAALPRR